LNQTLELVAQPPVFPLTVVEALGEFAADELLLQLYAFTAVGVFVIRIVDTIKITIPLIRNKRFIFVNILASIKVDNSVLLEHYSLGGLVRRTPTTRYYNYDS
jgi:hypothetical protein